MFDILTWVIVKMKIYLWIFKIKYEWLYEEIKESSTLALLMNTAHWHYLEIIHNSEWLTSFGFIGIELVVEFQCSKHHW